MAYQTLSDYYNPLDAAMKVQQIQAEQDRRRIMAMQMKEQIQAQQADQTYKQKLNEFGSPNYRNQLFDALEQPNNRLMPQMSNKQPNNQLMPQQPGQQSQNGQNMRQNAPNLTPQAQPQMPQPPTPEQQSMERGKQTLDEILPQAKEAYGKAVNDTEYGKKINALNDQLQSSDVQSYLNRSGFFDTETGHDDETKKMWIKTSRFYTQKDLDTAAQSDIPGAGQFRLASPGMLRVEMDPADNNRIRNVKPVNADIFKGKNLSREQLIDKSLHGTLAERKQAKETLDEMDKRTISTTQAKTAASTANQQPFSAWDKDDKEWWYQNRADTGEAPKFAFGDRRSYTEFNQGYAQWARGKGMSGAEAGAQAAEYKGLGGSLKNQEKVIGMMGSFTKNLDFQKQRLDSYLNKIGRVDYRLLNVPIRQAKMMVKGSPQESVLSMYLTDISNDAAKLSTGSSASISELSQSAQERWAKIHDPNLSVNDLRTLIAETQVAAHGRVKTAQDQINETKSQMKSGSKKEAEQAQPDQNDPLGLR